MNNADMPAMPLSGDSARIIYGRECNAMPNGLTKREYFAGLAMQSIIAAKHEEIKWWPQDMKEQSFAQAAVGYADLLLAELDKEEGQ